MPHSLLPDLKTPRLRWRPLVRGDAQALFALRSNEEVNRYLDRQVPTDAGDALRFIETIADKVAANQSAYWCITREAALIGTICLWNFSDDRRTADLGYELFPAAQGQGFMGEAIQKVLTFGFDVLGLDCVQAYTHPENKRSIKLLLGRQFEPDSLNNPGDESKFVRCKDGA